MKIRKWVDFGQEVDVEIGMEDIRSALGEAFSNVTADRLGEERPNRGNVARALNSIAGFLNALTDEHVALLSSAARSTVRTFLVKAADRFNP